LSIVNSCTCLRECIERKRINRSLCWPDHTIMYRYRCLQDGNAVQQNTPKKLRDNRARLDTLPYYVPHELIYIGQLGLCYIAHRGDLKPLHTWCHQLDTTNTRPFKHTSCRWDV